LGATRAGVTGEAPSDVLWHYNLSARHLDKLCERVDTFSVSGDGERLVVRHRDDTIVVPSSHKVDDDDPAYIRVDLTRLRRTVNPRAEWRQMFDENGRLMASHYWREDMNGVDWDGVLNRYRPLVDLCHV
ncbi:peptidase S41, partial [Xanthomonas citri pv. citri]|nr:peptidase S41 [Xanthomonas citri pv. citri]